MHTEESLATFRIILKCISKKIRCEGAEWIRLAQDVVQWRALVNKVRFQVLTA
jgi:hypothetical protein